MCAVLAARFTGAAAARKRARSTSAALRLLPAAAAGPPRAPLPEQAPIRVCTAPWPPAAASAEAWQAVDAPRLGRPCGCGDPGGGRGGGHGGGGRGGGRGQNCPCGCTGIAPCQFTCQPFGAPCTAQPGGTAGPPGQPPLMLSPPPQLPTPPPLGHAGGTLGALRMKLLGPPVLTPLKPSCSSCAAYPHRRPGPNPCSDLTPGPAGPARPPRPRLLPALARGAALRAGMDAGRSAGAAKAVDSRAARRGARAGRSASCSACSAPAARSLRESDRAAPGWGTAMAMDLSAFNSKLLRLQHTCSQESS